MTIAIIITLCSLLLLAYVFDLTSSKSRIPSVILLLLSGYMVRILTDIFEITVPDLSALLPVLGTVGLILIVLEGSLELEYHPSKTGMIKKSVWVSLLPMLTMAFLLSFLFRYFGGVPYDLGLINAIPLCIISSAIAIPSVKTLTPLHKEFIIYESSLSDIFGVLFFNFIALNSSFGIRTFGQFGLQLLLILAVSFIATIGLSLLLNKIDHHIKYAPIVLLVVLIYAVSKVYHLPGLLFILLFGLFLGNLDAMKHVRWIKRLKPDLLNREVHKFRDLVSEAAFLIRALFFLLFGFLIELADLINIQTLPWAATTVAGIFLLRALMLKLSGLPQSPLLYIAPRGLITILLFLSIEPARQITLLNKSLILQVILLTALIMMVGLIMHKSDRVVNNSNE